MHGYLSVADIKDKLVRSRKAELVLGYPLHFPELHEFRKINVVFFKLLLAHLPAEAHAFAALLVLYPLLYLGPRLGRYDELQPVLARRARRRGYYLHDVAVTEHVLQGHYLPVHPGPSAGVPYVAVNGVGEVNRRGSCREDLYRAL